MDDHALSRLTIGYSTLYTRAHSIVFPADGAGAEILVCVQGGDSTTLEYPPGIRRIDVPGRGVARSRNAVLDNATRRYALFCDDDVDVDLRGVLEGVRHLERTGRALALGRGTDPQGRLRKRYPSKVTRLTRMNSAKAATYEMLVDVEQVQAAGLRFDERFGAGVDDLHLGDEFIFIADLLDAGLRADAVPLVFGVHPATSSGSVWGGERDGHARAAAINRVFGRWARPARLAFGAKHLRELGGVAGLARFVGNGVRPGASRPSPGLEPASDG